MLCSQKKGLSLSNLPIEQKFLLKKIDLCSKIYITQSHLSLNRKTNIKHFLLFIYFSYEVQKTINRVTRKSK